MSQGYSCWNTQRRNGTEIQAELTKPMSFKNYCNYSDGARVPRWGIFNLQSFIMLWILEDNVYYEHTIHKNYVDILA